MNHISDRIFSSVQKDKLRELGCNDTTNIEVLIIGHCGDKLVRINGVEHLI